MKTMYFTEAEEMQFFLDENKEVISCWHINDADYREEYMGSLFKKLGYEVKFVKCNDKSIKKAILPTLNSLCGTNYSEKDDLFY